MKKLKSIDGGYRPNTWMHDPNIPQEEIDFFNDAFREATEQIDPVFEKLIWNKKSKHPKLRRIK
jgi:hypothetical protein